MKKTCAILMIIFMLSELTPTDTSGSTFTDTSEQLPESVTGGITLTIDNAHRYEGMDKAYKDGYVPIVKNGRAIIVLPLMASGELEGNSLNATPQLGDPATSPFVYKNYQTTVKKKDNPVNNGVKTISSYLVSYELSLAPDRLNGVYPVSIAIQAKNKESDEIAQSFTTYVTITDGKNEDDTDDGDPADSGDPTDSGDPATGGAPVAGGDPTDGGDPAVTGSEPQTEKATSQPKLIVSNYEVNPSTILAGKEFTVKAMLKNTNAKKHVQNITVDISCESPNLTLLNDSSTIFIEKLGKDEMTEIELKYKTDLETPNQKYNIDLAISYEDPDATPLQISGKLSITVSQSLNVKMELPKITTQVNAGDTMPLSLQVMNLGRSTVFNVRMELSVPGLIPSGMAFVGNMEAGTAAECKLDVFVGTKDMSEGYDGNVKYGVTNGTLTLIYEDIGGQEFKDSIDISTTIHEPVISASNVELEEKPETASQWWVSIVIGSVVLCALIAFLAIRRREVK